MAYLLRSLIAQMTLNQHMIPSIPATNAILGFKIETKLNMAAIGYTIMASMSPYAPPGACVLDPELTCDINQYKSIMLIETVIPKAPADTRGRKTEDAKMIAPISTISRQYSISFTLNDRILVLTISEFRYAASNCLTR